MVSSSRANRTAIAIALALAVIAIGAAPARAENGTLPTAKPEQVGMSSERLERLTDRMQWYIDEGKVAGTVTLIAREGKVVHYRAQGFKNREEKVPMKEDDIFVIMSMTKPLVSTALMMLFEEGHFLLSDPISKFLPEYENLKVGGENGESVPARPITFRDALTHTSGVGRAPRGGERPENIREAVAQLAQTPLSFQPGDRWSYGNSTDLCAALVEVISGQDLDTFMRERIFNPLGMHDTHYNVPAEKANRRPTLYVPNREDGSITARPLGPPRTTTVFRGVAGLSSTAGDYFKFHQMILNGGEYNGVRLLSPKTIDLMITNHVGDHEVNIAGPGYGFGLGYSVLLDPGKAYGAASPGTFGWGGAWGTYFFVDPVEELIVIFMTQISSYSHLNIRQDVGTLAETAIVAPKSSGERKIMGYKPIPAGAGY